LKTVLFVRHGQSEAQVGLPTDAPGAARLTALGREQAKHLARHLHSVWYGSSPLVTSSFQRSIETADIIMQDDRTRHARTQMPVQEFTYLAWEGLRGTTAAQRAARVEAYWNAYNTTRVDGPGGRITVFFERSWISCKESALMTTSPGSPTTPRLLLDCICQNGHKWATLCDVIISIFVCGADTEYCPACGEHWSGIRISDWNKAKRVPEFDSIRGT